VVEKRPWLVCRKTHQQLQPQKESNVFYTLYRFLINGLFLTFFPFGCLYMAVTGRFKEHFRERLGFLPKKIVRPGQPRIWIHGASLGEVQVGKSIIHELIKVFPGCNIHFSTMTPHGRRAALKTLGPNIPVVYAPLDVPLCVKRALSSVKPDVMVFLETEIWPSWIFEAQRLGIRMVMVNGRISPRSFNGYVKFRALFRAVLEKIDRFSMISEKDAQRIEKMGAPAGRIRVNGNAKYDHLSTAPDMILADKMKQGLNLKSSDLIWVAGSTREGEESLLLDTYRILLEKFPDLRLILAPRHIVRTPDITRLIRERGFSCQLKTELNDDNNLWTDQILVLDTFGELFSIYGTATLVFCGASLVPLGGQNPFEPAAWGKPVLYGPHMEDFLDAKTLLEANEAACGVINNDQLLTACVDLLENPEKARAMGKKGQEAVFENSGSAENHVKVITQLLEEPDQTGKP
jgi:3-deoxy-D-manno-octulosonic-acid transferase